MGPEPSQIRQSSASSSACGGHRKCGELEQPVTLHNKSGSIGDKPPDSRRDYARMCG